MGIYIYKYHFCWVLPGYLVVLFENPLPSIDRSIMKGHYLIINFTTFKYFTCFSSFKRILVGGFNPSEKYSSNWIISPNRGENKRYLKPPTRLLDYPPWNDHISPASCHFFSSMVVVLFPVWWEMFHLSLEGNLYIPKYTHCISRR